MRVVNNRKDILSRKSYPREELLRFVIKDNVLTLDNDKTLPGRGAYLKKGSGKEAVLKKAFNSFIHRPLDKKEEELISRL